MIKYFSDVTNKWYDTPEEASAAEEKKQAEELEKKRAEEELLNKIDEIENKRIKEVADIDNKIETKLTEIRLREKEIEELKLDKKNINYEASMQINELKEKTAPNTAFSFKYKSLNSGDPSKNIEFETTDYDEAIKKLKSLSGKGLNSLLDKFGI